MWFTRVTPTITGVLLNDENSHFCIYVMYLYISIYVYMSYRHDNFKVSLTNLPAHDTEYGHLGS